MKGMSEGGPLSLFTTSSLSELCPLQAQTTSSTRKESLCEVAYEKNIVCKV